MKKRDLRVIFTISGGWAGRTPFSGAIAYRSPVQLEGGWIDGNCSSTQWNATRHEGLLELNAGVTTIGGGQSTDFSPFYGKSFVTGVDISGSTIRNIGDYTFYGCSGLEYMEIPEQITSIGDYAFYCANLSEVVCRATTPPALGSHNFNASSTMLYVPAESVEAYRADEDWSASVLRIYPIGYEQKYIRYNAESAVSGAWLTANTDTGLNEFDEETGDGVLYLNSGVTTIGGGQSTDYSPFYGKSDLASVDISESGIATIGDSAFRGCTVLASIDIPNSITSIGNSAFRGSGLTSVVIPNSVTRISNATFTSCTALASVTIPNSVTAIGNSAFQSCTTLASITIPSSVESIGYYAFYDCANLTTVTCQAVTPPTLGGYNFPATDTLYVPMEGYEAYRADEDWTSVFTSIRPQGYTYITVGAGEHGSATGSGWYQVNAYVIITATADEHYHFSQWNDGSTSNPRAIIVGSTDTAYTATFAIDEYTLVVTGDAHTTVTGSGTYGYGSEVEITATPAEHYHFTAWSDGNTNATRTITVTENITLSASSEINEYTLTVSAGQHGTATGSGTYPYGTQVQISATADTDYHFAQWNDGNTDNPRTVVVSGDATYTASFESDAFTVTITGDAHTTVTGSGSYPYGTQVQISATPDEHYHFVAWSDGDTNATRTITVTGNITLSASSAIDTYTLTVTGDAHTAVSGSGTYGYGSEVEITATPAEHYHFTAWSDGNTNATRTITVTENITLSASSAINEYTLTVTGDAHTTVSGSGTYPYGTQVQVSATPDEHYHFSQWNDGNTDNPRTVVVTDDIALSATSAIDTYTLTVTGDAHTTVSGSGTYPYGTQVQISATPAEHYHFTAWSDGNTNATRTITVTGNIALSASSAIDTYTLTVTGDAHTAVTGSGTYGYGTEVQITATPDSHYHFTAWSDGNTDNPRTVVVTGNIALSASSAIDTYTITVSAGQHGSATGSGTYAYGTSVQISATADTGYEFSQWNDGNTSNPRTITVTGNATYTASFEEISSVIRYTSTNQATGDWVTNNTKTSRNTYNSTTHEGVLYLNSGVTTIGGGSGASYTPFQSDTGLTRIDFSDSGLTTIGAYTCNACTNLTTAVIGDSVTSLGTANDGYGVFEGCTRLSNVSIGNSVTLIGKYAFYQCSALATLVIPSSVTTISQSATGSCSNLTSVTCNATTPPTLGTSNFPASMDFLYVPSASKSAYKSNSSWSSAFMGIFQIGYVVKYIRYVASSAVSGAWLTANTDTSNNRYDSSTDEGYIFLKSGVTTIGGGQSTDYSPFYSKNDISLLDFSKSGLTTFGSYTLNSNGTSMTSLTLPSGLVTISDYGIYYGTGSITSLTIPNTVTTIGKQGIRTNTNSTLASLTIGSGVRSIGQQGIYGYSSLKTVTCRATTPPTLGSNCFTASGDTLKVPSGSVSAYQNNSSWSGAFATITSI